MNDRSLESGPGDVDWGSVRDEMPVTGRWAYFDHAAVAPISTATRAAIDAWTRDTERDGVAAWAGWRPSVENTRRLGATLLGAESREVALVRSTTEGLSIVAEAYPWEPGDNVVTFAGEFPSNRHPWANLATRGVECRVVPTTNGRFDLGRLADTIDRRTRIVSLSWVDYVTGNQVDLDAVAAVVHDAGALLCVDGIQGLGVLPLDVSRTPIDFLAADGHKWLLGPEGAGLLYVRSEHLDTLRPVGVGWNSVRNWTDFSVEEFDPKPSAARYEGGTYAMPGLVGFEAALRQLLEWGLDATVARMRTVTDELVARLEGIGSNVAGDRSDTHWSGIVSADPLGADPQAVKRHGLAAGVQLNVRGDRLRISPHVYTDAGDLDRLVELLAERRPHR